MNTAPATTYTGPDAVTRRAGRNARRAARVIAKRNAAATTVREDLVLTVALACEAKGWSDDDAITTVAFALGLPALTDAEYTAVTDLLS